MPVSTVHVLHGINTGSGFISQLSDVTVNPGLQEIIDQGAGYPEPQFAGALGLDPTISFGCTQLATLLGITTSANLFSAGFASNVDLYFRQVTAEGVRTASSSTVHKRMRAALSMLYLSSISAGHQRRATAQGMFQVLFNGTDQPLLPAGSVSLAGTPAGQEVFTLGPVVVNGTPLVGVSDITIDIKPEIIKAGTASEIANSYCAIGSISPSVTIRGLEMGYLHSIGLVGTALSDLTIYLRRANLDAASGLPYAANASAVHIAFTATAGFIRASGARGGGNRAGGTDLQILLRAPTDLSATALTVATGQAIS